MSAALRVTSTTSAGPREPLEDRGGVAPHDDDAVDPAIGLDGQLLAHDRLGRERRASGAAADSRPDRWPPGRSLGGGRERRVGAGSGRSAPGSLAATTSPVGTADLDAERAGRSGQRRERVLEGGDAIGRRCGTGSRSVGRA